MRLCKQGIGEEINPSLFHFGKHNARRFRRLARQTPLARAQTLNIDYEYGV